MKAQKANGSRCTASRRGREICLTSEKPERISTPPAPPRPRPRKRQPRDFSSRSRSIGRRGPLGNAIRARLRERWGPHRARLNDCLVSLVLLLVGHGGCSRGERVAWPVEGLARALGIAPRSVTRLIGHLRQDFPDLVTVHEIAAGQTAYDGEPSRRDHLEYELGETLRAALANPDKSRGRQEPRARRTLPPVNRPPAAENPPPARPRSAASLSPDLDLRSRNPFSFAEPTDRARALARTVIATHRQIAEPGKGSWVPVSAGELAMVASAIDSLPGSEASRLEQCATASRLALAASIANGRTSATLRFTFGEPLGELAGYWLRHRLGAPRTRKAPRSTPVHARPLAPSQPRRRPVKRARATHGPALPPAELYSLAAGWLSDYRASKALASADPIHV